MQESDCWVCHADIPEDMDAQRNKHILSPGSALILHILQSSGVFFLFNCREYFLLCCFEAVIQEIRRERTSLEKIARKQMAL